MLVGGGKKRKKKQKKEDCLNGTIKPEPMSKRSSNCALTLSSSKASLLDCIVPAVKVRKTRKVTVTEKETERETSLF